MASAAADENDVALTPAEIARLGIETTVLVATKQATHATGVGVVMSHEVIAQAAADLATAVAVERQSRAAFERSRGLANTPGALPLDVLENTQRQATVDGAALQLQKRRLSSLYGQSPPWAGNDKTRDLIALASGRSKLVRITFPLGTVLDAMPDDLRFAHLAASTDDKSWKATAIWSAPADASAPGKSYFAILREGDFGEGERVLVRATSAESQIGVTIPTAAAVIAGGRYWYYREEKPGAFVRQELDTGAPNDDGYFIAGASAAGKRVVTSGAAQLLARDTGTGKDSD